MLSRKQEMWATQDCHESRRVLILEDNLDRTRVFRKNMIGHVYKIVTNARPCIEELQKETWDWLFLDHDLNGQTYVPSGPDTGWEVAEWLSRNPDRKPKNIIIHTMNEKAAPKMLELLPGALWKPGMCGFSYESMQW